VRCPNCGTNLRPAGKFCRECGARLGVSDKPSGTTAKGRSRQSAPVAGPASPAQPEPAAKYCPNGHRMDPSWTECPECVPTKKGVARARVEPTEPANAGEAGASPVALLIGLSGDFEGKSLKLVRGANTIGAGASCGLVIRDKYVSRHHATITIEENEFVLTDQKSRNGTFVNNLRITRVDLRDNDKIKFGVDAVFQFKRLK
jgi:hypothetical protein